MKSVVRVAVAVAALISALLVGPAPVRADAPNTRTVSTSFTDINACTGFDHEVNIEFTVTEHLDHNNNFVLHFSSEVTTSDGYEGRGVGTRTASDANAMVALNYIVRSTETDDAYRIQQVFGFDGETGELVRAQEAYVCLGR